MAARKRCLAIVERAFRGAIEEQYGHILWLTLCLRRMGGEVGLMLRGNTVLHGLRDQPRQTLALGDTQVTHLPHYESVVHALLQERVAVHVERAALQRLGIDEKRLIDGTSCFDPEDLSSIVHGYDRIWYW